MAKTWNLEALARGIAKHDNYSYSKGLQEAHDLAKAGKVKLSKAATRRKKKKHTSVSSPKGS